MSLTEEEKKVTDRRLIAQTIVVTSDSQAKKEWVDMVIMTCIRSCGAELKQALSEEI